MDEFEHTSLTGKVVGIEYSKDEIIEALSRRCYRPIMLPTPVYRQLMKAMGVMQTRIESRVRCEINGDDLTLITEELDDAQSHTWREHSRQVLCLRERAVRDALISLGWTPPGWQADVSIESLRSIIARTDRKMTDGDLRIMADRADRLKNQFVDDLRRICKAHGFNETPYNTWAEAVEALIEFRKKEP